MVEFRDPARRRGAPVLAEATLGMVRARPGEWAVVATLPSRRWLTSFVARLRRSEAAAGFVFTTSGLPNGAGEVFAIFTGATGS